MRVTCYEDGSWETFRLFICPACYSELIVEEDGWDTTPLYTPDDAGFACYRCGKDTVG